VGLARVERLRGNNQGAVAYFNQAITTFPQFWPPSTDLAKLFAEMSLYDEAIAALDAAVATNPKVAYLKKLRSEMQQQRQTSNAVTD